jgi:type VI secretion system protein ImpL
MTTFNKTKYSQENLLLLDKHFQQLLQYLREQKRKKTPLHIVIGRQECGKTTLIRQAELNFLQIIPAIPTYKKENGQDPRKSYLLSEAPGKNDNSDDYCRWWITEQGILLDIPGSFTDPLDNSAQQIFWRHLLKLLRKTKKYLQLQAILYVISVPDLLSLEKTEQLPWLQQHKMLLLDLSKRLRTKFTLYFLVTKCDLLHGFNEYFDDLRADERVQCLGCTFEKTISNNKDDIKNFGEKPLRDIFNLNFDYLLDQLNAHVISRVHQERHLGKRAIIKEFPLQFETLQPLLTNLIAELAEKTLYCDASDPSGIYFTSAFQRAGDFIIDRLQPSLMTAFEFADKPYQTILTHDSRAYFINCFFVDLLTHSNKVKKKFSWRAAPRWFKNISYAQLAISSALVMGLIIISGTTVWQYQQDKHLLASSELALKNYQLQFSHLKPQTTSLTQTIAALNSIYQAKKLITQTDQSWFMKINFLTHGNMTAKANRAYRTTLQTFLLPQLQQSVENKLLANNTEPQDLFQTLKAYLMLGNLQRRQSNYIITWAMKNWQTTLPKQTDSNFQYYLQDLLTNNTKIILNPLAIAQARHVLNDYPKAYLAYLAITESASNQTLPSFTTGIIVNKNIPYLYTVAGYKYIFLKELIALNNKQFTDSWVLQDSTGTNPLDTVNQYNKQILDLYFKNYVNWWQNYLHAALDPKFNSIDQALVLLNNLTSDSTNLKNSLRAIAGNITAQLFVQAAQTRNSTLSPLIQTSVAENFADTLIPAQKALTNLTNSDVNFQKTFSALRKLQDYLKTLRTAKDKPETAFQLAALHANAEENNDPLNNLFSIAKQQPPLLQDWLTSIGTNSWQIVLHLTKDYLNEKWQSEILPLYNSSINNHYPIVNNATKDISLASFSQFFGENGVLVHFFDNYLKPFITTEDVQWQWKTINGISLPISNTIPQLFERARIIRQMFFPNNANDPQFHFVLKPVTIEPIIAKITFNFSGQSILATPTKHMASEFFWPGSNKNLASVTIINTNQQQISDIKNGSFALFRLLNDAQLQATKDPKLYTLTFYLNGLLAAEYRLVVDNEINPFIPHIIDQFKCPPSL